MQYFLKPFSLRRYYIYHSCDTVQLLIITIFYWYFRYFPFDISLCYCQFQRTECDTWKHIVTILIKAVTSVLIGWTYISSTITTRHITLAVTLPIIFVSTLLKLFSVYYERERTQNIMKNWARNNIALCYSSQCQVKYLVVKDKLAVQIDYCTIL